MSIAIKNIFISNKTRLNLIYFCAVVWLSLVTWPFVWPITWLSALFLFVFGYIVVRLLFELTFNRSNVPTMASCYIARQKIADVLRREAAKYKKETYNIVDLGSGRGELARCIAKKIQNAKVTGIEQALFPFMQAALIKRFLGPKNLSFECRDFWSFDCGSVDAVVLYVGPLTTQRVGEKLRRELKPGSMVVSNTYPLLGDWTPIDVLTFYSPFKEVFYVYRHG